MKMVYDFFKIINMGNKNVKELKALWNLEETKEFKTFVNSEIWKIINLLWKKKLGNVVSFTKLKDLCKEAFSKDNLKTSIIW